MKKLLSCVISLALIICLIPETAGIAFADDKDPVYQQGSEEVKAASGVTELPEDPVSEVASQEATEDVSTPEYISEYAVRDESEIKSNDGEVGSDILAGDSDIISKSDDSEREAVDNRENENGSLAISGISKESKSAAADNSASSDQEQSAGNSDETADPQNGGDVSGNDPDEETAEVVDISNAKVRLSRTVYKYNGKDKTPNVVSVKLPDGTKLKSDAYKVSYSKNTKPGTAKVTIKGLKSKDTKGKVIAEFTILGEVKGLAVKETKTSSVTLTWDKYEDSDIRGYKVLQYDADKKEYSEVKTVKDPSATETKVNGLSDKSKYRFKVVVYDKDGVTKEMITGARGSSVTAHTLPKAPTEKTSITSLYSKAPYVQVKWKNLGENTANRYQIQYSTSSSFKNAETITVKSSKATKKRIYGLRNYTRYYVRVRAGMAYAGQEAYGKWSSAENVYSRSTGWTTYKGRQYYYLNGKTLKGSHTINGNPCYFDPKTGEFHGCSKKIWNKIKDLDSDTQSLVSVDCVHHRVNVFRKKNGDWVCIKQWICSTGQTEVNGDYKKTPKGVFKLRYKLRHFGEEHGYTCWYASNFSGHSFIHSVLYNPYSLTSVQDGRLGINASHGCVRLKLENAKWIYDHVKKGSTIVAMNG